MGVSRELSRENRPRYIDSALYIANTTATSITTTTVTTTTGTTTSSDSLCLPRRVETEVKLKGMKWRYQWFVNEKKMYGWNNLQ